ncbi:MAG: Crp/Fnr family transcriptional regulator [Deltaproteobacteria bacterium]|nr:Crp/Fnr family transcriptional regulator [Deltaproteobacteria bacterium]
MHKDSICGICNCVIRDNTLFSALTDKQIDTFKYAIITTLHRKRDVVFMEQDTCNGLYIIRSGRVKLVRSSRRGKEQILKILQPGDIIGTEVFYNAKTYGNTAIAMEETELCYLKKDDFFEILKTEPEIAKKLIISLARELDQAYAQIGNMGLLNAREKMAHLLYTLAVEYGKSENNTVRLQLTFSRLEIAELLGITQETSIRLLKGFKDDDILDIKRKELIIKSLARLKEIGGIE